MSQTELGDCVGVSQAAISFLEHGIVKVSPFIMDEIKKTLEFPFKPERLLDFAYPEVANANS